MKRKILISLFFVIFFILPLISAEGLAKRYIVKFDNEHKNTFPLGQNTVKKLGELAIVEGLDEYELMNRRDVIYFEEDYKVKALGETPWNFKSIGLNFSEIDEDFGQGVKIAVLDTGADFSLLDVESGYDFIGGDSDAFDDNGHGTFVIQLLKASMTNLPLRKAEVYAVKVLDENGGGYDSDIIQGLNWAINNNIDIVLMSFGGPDDSLFLHEATDFANKNGILLIAAVGNDNEKFIMYPAAYGSVIATGSVNEDLQRSIFSNYGAELELMAPGENILVSDGINSYIVEGTSFSVPHVGVVAAGIFSEIPDIENEEVREILHESALDLGQEGKDNQFGYGLVQYNATIIAMHKVFSDVGCPDLCCDEYEHFKQNGEQPDNLSDENVCISDDVYFRNYYCDGDSANELYQDSLIEDCKSVCEDGKCLPEPKPLCMIYSPGDFSAYPERMIAFNISAFEKLDKIEYIDYSGTRPRWKTLCSKCAEYGFERKMANSFNDGEHEIAIKCVPSYGDGEIHELSFFSDSRDPRISKTEPKSESFTNGSDFYVKYTEDNCQSLELNVLMQSSAFGVADSCQSGANIEKAMVVDLSLYNNQGIEYQFVIRDIANNSEESKKTKVKVDTIAPLVNSFNYMVDGRRVNFVFNVTEENLGEISYIDLSDYKPRKIRVCSKLKNGICSVKKSFRAGEHNLSILVLDKAGNSATQDIQFVLA